MLVGGKEHAAEMAGRTAREDDLPYGFRTPAATSGPGGLLLLDLSGKMRWTRDIKAKALGDGKVRGIFCSLGKQT